MENLNSCDRALMERVGANFIESYRLLARLSPQGGIEEADGLTTIATGVPSAYFNPAFVTRPLVEPKALADRLRRFYDEAGMPGLLVATDDGTIEHVASLARAAALSPADPLPAMLLAPIPNATSSGPPGLEIQVVDDATSLRIHNDTLGASPLLACFENPAILRVADMTLYVGILAGEPVAHALRFTSHRIAGIYNVGTLASHRRRGVGAALTWRAAADGRAEGCLASALQPSPMAFSLYRRMGYRHVTDYQTWGI